jgi:hypothetical protein
MIADGPGASSQSDLKQGVTIQQDNDRDKEPQGEGVMSGRRMRSVEAVRFGEFLLVMLEPLLLFRAQDTELLCFGVFEIFFLDSGKIVMVLEFGESFLLAQTP